MPYRPAAVQRPIPRSSPERTRLMFMLLLSVLVHLLLLRLTFSGQGLWIPGFSFPWQERRIVAPDLRVRIAPAQLAAAEPLQQALAEPIAATAPSPTPSVSPAPITRPLAAAKVPETRPSVEAKPVTIAAPTTDAATVIAAAPAPVIADRPVVPEPPPVPAPVIDVAKSDEAKLVVPLPPPTVVPPPVPDAGEAARAREQLEAARQEELRQEAVRAENARLETERQEAARIEAAKVEAARVESSRVEASRIEAARIEAARIEAARVELARLEAERDKAARIEAARLEAARVELARREAERLEAERLKAAKIEAARLEAEQEAARRDAVRRALGRQLDEEADRRDAAAAAARLSPSYSAARRYRLFGRTDPNAEIILYAEAWSRKIQMNMTLDMVREAANERHTDPLVTVAIRSDGSVESVTFITSSGVAAIDAAIRRIVESQAPYRVFPPGLASEYDVIEIRRSWHFDIAVRLY